MKNFNELSQEERDYFLSNRIDTELLVDRNTINFENIELDLKGTDVTKDFEVPPIIIDNNHLSQILTFSGTDNKGRWIRTMLRTYMQNGRVLYRKFDKDKFVATLKFN